MKFLWNAIHPGHTEQEIKRKGLQNELRTAHVVLACFGMFWQDTMMVCKSLSWGTLAQYDTCRFPARCSIASTGLSSFYRSKDYPEIFWVSSVFGQTQFHSWYRWFNHLTLPQQMHLVRVNAEDGDGSISRREFDQMLLWADESWWYRFVMQHIFWETKKERTTEKTPRQGQEQKIGRKKEPHLIGRWSMIE